MQPLLMPGMVQLHPLRQEQGAPGGFGAVGRVEISASEAQPLPSRVSRVLMVELAGAELGERQSPAPPPQQPGSPEGRGPSCLPLLLTANARLETESCLLISPEQPSDGAERGASI